MYFFWKLYIFDYFLWEKIQKFCIFLSFIVYFSFKNCAFSIYFLGEEKIKNCVFSFYLLCIFILKIEYFRFFFVRKNQKLSIFLLFTVHFSFKSCVLSIYFLWRTPFISCVFFIYFLCIFLLINVVKTFNPTILTPSSDKEGKQIKGKV